MLLRNPGKLLSQQQLLAEVWGPGYADAAGNLRLYMAQLRRKLEPDPARPRWLLTEPGMGYRYQPDPGSRTGLARHGLAPAAVPGRGWSGSGLHRRELRSGRSWPATGCLAIASRAVNGDSRQPVPQAADHHVLGAALDRLLEHEAALVVQDPLPRPGGLYFGDQHYQLLMAWLRLPARRR